MTTTMVGGVLIGSLVVVALLWMAVEIMTLRDKIPGNHITPVVRGAYRQEPGPFIIFAMCLGYLMGHLFWP